MTHAKMIAIGLLVAGLASPAAPGEAKGRAAVKAATVSATYPGLASGGLTHATLAGLPAGTILKAGGLVIAEKELAAEVAKAPPEVREQLKKNTFFLLEQMATGKLLLRAAKARSAAGASSDREVVGAYLKAVAGKAAVTDAEVASFSRDNQAMFGGAALAKVKSQIGAYLLQQKQQELVGEHVRTLGQRDAIVASASWTKAAAAMARDNPVDRARTSGKPSLVDFGADGCRPCEMMTPILAALKEQHAGKLNVLFVHVRKEQVLAARYGVRSIPVQVFFDASGKEVSRHVGFYARSEIDKQLAGMGVK